MRKKEKKRGEREKEGERGMGEKREKDVNTIYDLFILFGFPLLVSYRPLLPFFARLSSSLGKGLSDPPVPDL